jgi:hypothetical protein
LDEKVILENICSEDIYLEDWSIKDEGRKKYVFSGIVLERGEKVIITNEDFNETYVWTKSGDSIFVRDKENKLVYFESY